MRTSFSNYPKGHNSKTIFDVLGETLFNTDLDEWRSHRRVVQAFISDPRFLQANLKINLDVIERGLLPVFEQVSKYGIVVDLQDLFLRLMYDMASLMTTGYDPATLRVGFPIVAFAKALDNAGYMFLIRCFWPERLWKVQKWLGKSWHKAKQVMDEIAANIIERKQEELKKGQDSNHDEEGFDALKYLLTDDVLRSTLPKSALRDTGVGLMFAARDSTGAVLSWFFWLLSKNPFVEELTAQISVPEAPNAGILLDIEKLKNLVYLHAALRETLRLFPLFPFQWRVSIKPDILPSGHRVNPNTDVILCSYAMGRMESIWGEDCLEFKPERWISEEGRVRLETSNKFLAFSSGPRICPGKELAFTILKAVLVTVIHNYHVQVVEGPSSDACKL